MSVLSFPLTCCAIAGTYAYSQTVDFPEQPPTATGSEAQGASGTVWVAGMALAPVTNSDFHGAVVSVFSRVHTHTHTKLEAYDSNLFRP